MQVPKLSLDQWEFLAALEACGEPVPLGFLKTMAPLEQEPLQDLLSQWGKLGWINRTTDDLINLTPDLPETVKYNLKSLNTPERVSVLIGRIPDVLTENMGKGIMTNLLANSGRTIEAAYIELEVAQEFLAKGNHYQAYQYISRAIAKLHKDIEGRGKDDRSLFVESVLKLSHLSFTVGRGMRVMASYLRTAIKLAKSLGNNRSYALACLHLGRLLTYLDETSDEALTWLSAGKEEVENLGDNDILILAADFIGIYFVAQNRFEEALVHFGRAEQLFTLDKYQPLIFPMSLWHLGMTLFITGNVPRALGQLQSYWHTAKDMGWPAVASIARALLGLTLASVLKRREALFHLKAALKEALESKNAYSLYFARVGLAIQSYHDGNQKKAFDLLQIAVKEGQNAKSATWWTKYFLLEMLASFYNQGLEPIATGWEYKKELERNLSGSNPILKGIALRLKAEDKIRSGENASLIMDDLNASMDSFKQAGGAFALKDTLITMTRLHLREGHHEEARSLAQRVWKEIRGMGIGLECFPDDLRYLLECEDPNSVAKNYVQNYISRYLNHLHELDAIKEEDELMCRVMKGLIKLFGAERGALFDFLSRENRTTLLFRAGCNITEREVNSERFKLNLSLIHQAFRENKVMVVRPQPVQNPSNGLYIRRVLVIPIQVADDVKGVLYFENSYLEDNFDFLPPQSMILSANHLSIYIQHLLECIRLREETSRLTFYNYMQLEQLEDYSILTQAPVMLKILNQVEKCARSEATILVTGETGTGKELTVKRIHKLSKRSSGPFIVIDSTTIPENLVESELFGHEKGAFTGANRRKCGRMELAHEGTLFIDEIGELSVQIQSKLLRALEERAFYRVGGMRPVKSDFRLVTATNRNLLDDVKTGRFREDLYYRLNVISLFLPPLRDRGDDIILLAMHFLRHFSIRYGKKNFKLSNEDKDKMKTYQWPGNIRELKNVTERAVILSGGDQLVLNIPSGTESLKEHFYPDTATLDEVQRRYIKQILERTGGRISGQDGAAAILGMKRSSLYTRMYKLGLR